MTSTQRFSVFTKPWRIPLDELGAKIAGWGFEAIEFPVRSGYPVTPETVNTLPEAVAYLRDEWAIMVDSIAGPTDTATIEACGKAGVPIIRICPGLVKGESYLDGEARYQREWESLVPVLEANNVSIGVQNHSGRFVPVHAMGLIRSLTPFDPRHVCAVWDAAHNALEGEEPEMALDLLDGPHLRMVNLKNGYKRRVEADGEPARWRTFWTNGKDGVASWPRVVQELTRRNWKGTVCLTAEYTDPESVDQLIANDLAFAKSLFTSASF